MARKRHKPEEIVAKLRQVDVLTGQGMSVAEAVKTIAVTETTYFRWRAEYGGMKTDQVKRLKELEIENARLRRAVSDLTLDKLILTEAARETSEPRPPSCLRGEGAVGRSTYPSVARAGFWASTAPRSANRLGRPMTRRR